jgi:hypothetical protein
MGPTEGTALGRASSDSEVLSELDAGTKEAPVLKHGTTLDITYRADEDDTPKGLGLLDGETI